MKIKSSDLSIICLDDFKRDSSQKIVYRMFCKVCSKDRGYKRPAARRLACMSCGQVGKISSKKGKPISEQHRQNISKANFNFRKKLDPNYQPMCDLTKRISKNLRSRLWQALKASNPTSFSKSLGCTMIELRTHIELQFKPDMTWDNYGRKKDIKCWELDHIKPLSSFNLKCPEEFKQACHYTNLQPLWVSENRSKGATHGC